MRNSPFMFFRLVGCPDQHQYNLKSFPFSLETNYYYKGPEPHYRIVFSQKYFRADNNFFGNKFLNRWRSYYKMSFGTHLITPYLTVVFCWHKINNVWAL